MKSLFTLAVCIAFSIAASGQAIIFQEKFDALPGYSITGWGSSFSGRVPWQAATPFQLTPCIIPLGAMSENSGRNKVAGFAECGGFDFPDSNVLTTTPFIDLTSVSGPWLKYDSYFTNFTRGGDTEKATVEISADSGSTWTILEHVAQSVPLGAFDAHYLDLSAYSRSGPVLLGYRYNDGGGHMMGWAIDNVTVFTPAHKDIALLKATPNDSLLSYLSVGQSYLHRVTVYNNGLDTISAFDLCYQQGASPVMVKHIAGLHLAAFTTAAFTHDIPDTVLLTGRHSVKIWASLSGDTYSHNDSAIVYLHGVDFLPSKRLTIESGEGTYNGWSPRNMYYLSSVAARDESATLISIHEADPMVDTPYHDFFYHFGSNYVPYMLFDRRKSIPIDSFSYYFDVQKNYFGFADLSLNLSYTGALLYVKATVLPAVRLAGEFRLVLVLTEDGVRGTGAAWAQVNNYAGNAYGDMGGYEGLANPVPASDMMYNYVARAALPAPEGEPEMLPNTLWAGASYDYTFVTALNPNWDVTQLRAKVLLVKMDDHTVLNSNEVPFPVAVTNVNQPRPDALLYPNPATISTGVYLGKGAQGDVNIAVTDMAGRTLYTYHGAHLNSGSGAVELPVQQLCNGIYIVRVHSEGREHALKLEVRH